eukprot:9388637-Pyramimonas_sp.AAC.1
MQAPKITPRRLWRPPQGPQDGSRRPRNCSSGAHCGPRGTCDNTRSSQRHPQTTPRRSQDGPKGAQQKPKMPP